MPTGIICVNKAPGITSFGVVAKVRGIVREKKAGHTGTLDPMATGVLPVMLGGATRFLDFLPDSDKGYRASFALGKTTDTLDITGTVTGEYPVTATADDVAAALGEFRGKIMQLPPMYSAKSVNGVRLYELARQGMETEREACEVEIKELTLVGCENGEYTVDVLCSKGTYIRSLIDDIGKRLGCGAVMTSLQRTRAMGFTLDDCVTLEELQARRDADSGFDDVLFSVETLFDVCKKVTVSPAQAVRFANGGALSADRLKTPTAPGETVRVYAPEGVFLGLGRREQEELRVLRLLARRD